MSNLNLPQSSTVKFSVAGSDDAEQVANITRSINVELEDRRHEHPADAVFSLLRLPPSSDPTNLSWPKKIFSKAASSEPYEQEQAIRLLNHLWSSSAFQPFGSVPFRNNADDLSREKPDIAVLFPGSSADRPFWKDVIIPGEVKKTEESEGRWQICRYLRKVHQNRPGGANYVGFLVADRKLSVYVSNASGVMFTTPVELAKTNLGQLHKCIWILRNAQNLSWPPLRQIIQLQTDLGSDSIQTCEFIDDQVIFVKDSLKGSRTAVWSGTAVLNGNQERLPAILKSSWLPYHLLGQEQELVRLIRQTHQWGVPRILLSGVRIVNQGREEVSCGDPDLVRYREISVSCDDKYRTNYGIKIGNLGDCNQFLAGLSDVVRVLFLIWTKTRIHHRDVSIGNIALAPNLDVDRFLRTKGTRISEIVDRDPTALLIDWANGRRHLFRRGTDEARHPLDDAISGTLPYLSLNMLRISFSVDPMGSGIDVQKHHLPIDDLESIYWVLVFACDLKQENLRHWCIGNRSFSDKLALISGPSVNSLFVLENVVLTAWKMDKHPHLLIMKDLLIQLAETVRKLQDTFGRKSELDMDADQPEYEAKLNQADQEWEPLFAEFVEKLENAVSELKAAK